MRITDYPIAPDLLTDNVVLLDGPNGTKTITAGEMVYKLLHLAGPSIHRTVFRGKNLGGGHR